MDLTVLGFIASIVLTILKCVGIIGLAWWLVWAPFWGAIALGIILFILAITVGVKLGAKIMGRLGKQLDEVDW